MARQRSTTKDDVIRRLRARDRETDPVMSPNEIAAGMEASRPTISNRLHEMSEDGMVEYREVGQATVWWLADERMTEGDELEALEKEKNRRISELEEKKNRRISELEKEKNRRISELEKEKEKLSDERDRMRQFATAGALVTFGIILGSIGVSLPNTPMFGGTILATEGSSAVITAGSLVMIFGFIHWFWTAIKPATAPFVQKWYSKVANSIAKDTPTEA